METSILKLLSEFLVRIYLDIGLNLNSGIGLCLILN